MEAGGSAWSGEGVPTIVFSWSEGDCWKTGMPENTAFEVKLGDMGGGLVEDNLVGPCIPEVVGGSCSSL